MVASDKLFLTLFRMFLSISKSKRSQTSVNRFIILSSQKGFAFQQYSNQNYFSVYSSSKIKFTILCNFEILFQHNLMLLIAIIFLIIYETVIKLQY